MNHRALSEIASVEPHRTTRWSQRKHKPETYPDLPAAFQFIGWSQDASKVFFTCGTNGYHESQLGVCQTALENRDIKKLSPIITEVNPFAGTAMSPDHQFIYFQLEGRLPEKINVATGEDIQILIVSILEHSQSRPSMVASPQPSPSGKTVLFAFPEDNSIWLMNDDGTSNHKIVSNASSPEWKY